MSLLVPRLGEHEAWGMAEATAVSSPGGRGRVCIKTLTPCLPTHFLPSLQALSLPGWYLGILSQGAVWMWTSYEVGSGSRVRNFSNSVMRTCLRIGSLWPVLHCGVATAWAITFPLSPWGGRNPLFTKKAKFRKDCPSCTLMVYVMPGCNFKDLHSGDIIWVAFLGGTSIFEVCWSPESFLFVLPVETAGRV